MEMTVQMGEELTLTSGASGRIIPLFKNVKTSLNRFSLHRFILFVHSFFISLLLVLRRSRRRSSLPLSPPSSPRSSLLMVEKGPASSLRRRSAAWRREQEDVLRRRALAEGLDMVSDCEEMCRWRTSLFFGVTRNALFCREWFPVSGELRDGGLSRWDKRIFGRKHY